MSILKILLSYKLWGFLWITTMVCEFLMSLSMLTLPVPMLNIVGATGGILFVAGLPLLEVTMVMFLITYLMKG